MNVACYNDRSNTMNLEAHLGEADRKVVTRASIMGIQVEQWPVQREYRLYNGQYGNKVRP
jgi:hypothetical protein